ncbi:hypothetical protein P167DRAFT_539801 [Morchella conica CCBAS932]|uniref:Uncharacterized protein n=1 Tax=Morchella conica CCBAS932 TaxID=1392247 RepID=A0A3N4KER1_9PEZI|nr:hypothetical protein P167DRAFT_539801 [Morchella conica CCBAS932]
MVSPRSGTFRLVVFASVNVLKPGSWLIVRTPAHRSNITIGWAFPRFVDLFNGGPGGLKLQSFVSQ